MYATQPVGNQINRFHPGVLSRLCALDELLPAAKVKLLGNGQALQRVHTTRKVHPYQYKLIKKVHM